MIQLFNAVGDYFTTGAHVAYLGGATFILLLVIFIFMGGSRGTISAPLPLGSYLSFKYKIQGFSALLTGTCMLIFGIGVILFGVVNQNNSAYQMLFFPGGFADLLKLGGTFIVLGILSIAFGWYLLSRTRDS